MNAATAPAASTGPAGAPAKGRFAALPIIILILAQMGASGDNGALSLATSALTDQLGATTSDIQLANMIYPLVGGAFMVAGGLLGTMFGWKRSFRAGALVCAAGEVVLALAPSMAVFIWVGRVLVGLGASLLIPSVLGLVPLIYRGADRAVAFGCIGAASGLSALLPLALGVVMEAAGMRVTFMVLAVYFAAVAALSRLLPRIEHTRGGLRFDGAGVALAAVGLFLVLIGLSGISSWGLIAPFPGAPFTVFGISPALPAVACGIAVLAVLVRVERGVEARHGIALLPRSFLETPQVLAGLAANAITFFFMGAQSILMAPYLQLVAGWTPIELGVISIVTGVPTFACALGIPKLAPHAHPRHIVQLGYLAMAAALGIMALSVTLDGASSEGVFIGAFVAGVGAGTVSSQASNIVALALPERAAAQSGGIQSTMRNVGQAVGVALLGAVLIFGITTTVRAKADADPQISSEVRERLGGMTIDLGSNGSFEKQLSGVEMGDAERGALVGIESRARFTSTRAAYAVGALVVLLGLATTPAIKGASADRSGSSGDGVDRPGSAG